MGVASKKRTSLSIGLIDVLFYKKQSCIHDTVQISVKLKNQETRKP